MEAMQWVAICAQDLRVSAWECQGHIRHSPKREEKLLRVKPRSACAYLCVQVPVCQCVCVCDGLHTGHREPFSCQGPFGRL